VPSHYLEPLGQVAADRPVVFYDQLGCGRSERPTDASLWTIERFVAELERVRAELGLERVHLYGHSWGTNLACEYLQRRPAGVESVVLASPALSMSHWMHDADSLKATLPDSVQAVIAHHESAGTTDSPEYQAAVMMFYHRYILRRDPWPAVMDSAFAGMGVQVYTTMNGPSEFTITGSLRTYEAADRLAGIAVPALFTCGRYDEATPGTTRFYQSRVPGSRLLVFEQSAHLTMLDEPEAYVQAIRDWLREVEQR
jgi:proline iminopeptidase